MIHFWRTRRTIARARLDLSQLLSSIAQDLREESVKILRSSGLHSGARIFAAKLGLFSPEPSGSVLVSQPNCQASVTPDSRPIIFASYCAGEHFQGNLKFCGGTKELNYLIKLVRSHGYEAYVVTYDGTYEPWLLDHQPHIALKEFQELVKTKVNVRCVTSWAYATAFIETSPSLYFWDMELAHTDHDHFPVLANLYRQKIYNTASISRTIQAWHMAHFQKPCTLLPNFLDESLWSPLAVQLQSYRVGYMNEGSHTPAYIESIKSYVIEKGLALEFHQLRGVESEILTEMCSCEIYLSLNIGKDQFWGEGCPRTVIEAMSTGCIVIAFDIIGNREIMQDNFNSIIVPRYRTDLMAEALVSLYTVSGERDRLRSNSLSMIQACHTLESRWTAVKGFLQL